MKLFQQPGPKFGDHDVVPARNYPLHTNLRNEYCDKQFFYRHPTRQHSAKSYAHILLLQIDFSDNDILKLINCIFKKDRWAWFT